MLKRIIPIEARLDGLAEDSERKFFDRHQKKKGHASPTNIPEYTSFIGRWSLVAQTGYREWLAARAMGVEEIDAHIKSLFNDTWVAISDTKEGIKITTSSKVRGKLRRQVASFEYVLDGVTALTMHYKRQKLLLKKVLYRVQVWLYLLLEMLLKIEIIVIEEWEDKLYLEHVLHH